MTDISFTAPLDHLDLVTEVAAALCKEINAEGVEVNPHIAKVSLVGAGMKSYSGVAARMFRTLSDKDINISMISTSPICISVIVDADDCAAAVQALHTAFGLDEEGEPGSVKVVL